MQNASDWKCLVDILREGRIFIQPHDYPDPDAIASAYALRYFLFQMGVSAEICYKGDTERASVQTAIEEFNIPVIPFSDALNMGEKDKIVLVDGQKFNANVTDLPGDEVACLDHHPVFREIDYAYSDIRLVGACSSIIADYFFCADMPMPPDIATILLFGLHIDTSFMTRGVAELDLEVFPKLFRLADQKKLELIESRSLEFTDLQAFGEAINNIEIYGRTGFAHIPFACPDALIAQVADFILSLAEVDIAIIHSSRPNGLKYSVRSVLSEVHSGYMLAEVMPPYGSGGGHAGKAGGFVSREVMEKSGVLEEDLVRILEQRFLNYIAAHKADS